MLFTAAIVAVSMAASTAQSWSQSPYGTGAEHNASVRAVERSSTTAGDIGGMSDRQLLQKEIETAPFERHQLIGIIDGRNAAFTMPGVAPQSQVRVFRNGLLLHAAVDYTLENNNSELSIKFFASAIPNVGDFVEAYCLPVASPLRDHEYPLQGADATVERVAVEQARDARLTQLRPQRRLDAATEAATTVDAGAMLSSSAVEALQRRLRTTGSCQATGILGIQTCRSNKSAKEQPSPRYVLGRAAPAFNDTNTDAPEAAPLVSLRRLQSRIVAGQADDLHLSTTEEWLIRSGAALDRLRRLVPTLHGTGGK